MAKAACEEDPCIWDAGHSGPHAFPCKPCGRKGIVPLRDNWGRCPICKGRGWSDVKRKKGKKTT